MATTRKFNALIVPENVQLLPGEYRHRFVRNVGNKVLLRWGPLLPQRDRQEPQAEQSQPRSSDTGSRCSVSLLQRVWAFVASLSAS